MTKHKKDITLEDDEPEVTPMASPDPVSSPGKPVPAVVAPANASPVSPESRTSPYPGSGYYIVALAA